MTTTPSKSRHQKQQNASRFIKTTLLLSTFLLSLSGQSFAAPASQIESNSDAQKLRAAMKAQAAKNAASVDDLLGDLAAPVSSNQGGYVGSSRVFDVQFDSYARKVKAAIQKEFRDSDSFGGLTCELQLKFSSNGLLRSVTPKNSPANDIALCNAAIKAAELARMPAPPSLDFINVLNKAGFTIVFKP